MRLIVDNMSCQHCVKTITQALNEIDPNAKIEIDLSKKEVNIESKTITQEVAISAIDEAGFQFVSMVS